MTAHPRLLIITDSPVPRDGVVAVRPFDTRALSGHRFDRVLLRGDIDLTPQLLSWIKKHVLPCLLPAWKDRMSEAQARAILAAYPGADLSGFTIDGSLSADELARQEAARASQI